MLSQRTRLWWRNIKGRPTVQLLIQGQTFDGNAVLADGDTAQKIVGTVFDSNPRVVTFYGAGVEQLLEHFVVIVIGPTAPGHSD